VASVISKLISFRRVDGFPEVFHYKKGGRVRSTWVWEFKFYWSERC